MTKYLLGLIGHPISHSLSPPLHLAALQYAGLKGEYCLFDVPPEKLTTDLEHMLASGLNGFNITIPYKEAIYKLVNSYTNEAKLTGAVNTVKVEPDGKLSGHNTDLIGFKLALTDVVDNNLKNKHALVIGAGGAAKAAVIALAQLGLTQIYIRARNANKVNSFIEEMQINFSHLKGNGMPTLSASTEYHSHEIAIVVNASPIGLDNAPPPSWLNDLITTLPSNCICFDMVYKKNGTAPLFAQLAESKQLTTLDGLPMLIHQARYAFEYWTGINVPSEIMRAALPF